MDGERILVTTDLSKNARPAAKTALDLARRMDLEVEVMHVFDLTQRGATDKIKVFHDPELRERAEERVWDWFEETTQSAPDYVTLTTGDPAEEIRERAFSDDIACIAISMSGRGAWSKLIFGSTALKVVSRPPCVTAVVHPEFHRITDGITLAVGTDFSEASDAALKEALWFARRLDASIRVVHANALPAHTVIHEGELPAGMATTEIVEWARESMDAFLERHRALIEGFDVEGKVVTDHPVAGLRSFVEERGVDWMILGHRRPEQRSGATTVKGKWVQQMNCSTLLVPSGRASQ